MTDKFGCYEERYEHFLMACEANSIDLTNEFDKWLDINGFFTAPASTKYHGVYDGGLFDHSWAVFGRLAELSDNNHLQWNRPQSPFIIGMFHDLCKCDQYIKVQDDAGSHYEYNTNTILKGHGAKSVMLLSQFMTLTEEEMLCIRYHMGAYEKDEWQELGLAIKIEPKILYTHLADMLASHVDNT